MAENIDCASFKKNPELFKIKLRNAVEQITADDTSEKFNVPPDTQDLLEKHKKILEKEFHKIVYNFIDNMWNQMDINSKMSFLCDLEAQYPENFVAWRPTTGEVPIMSLKGAYLTEIKERLLYKIHKFSKESEELKQKHSIQLNALKNSIEKINKAEEHLSNLHHEFKEIMK